MLLCSCRRKVELKEKEREISDNVRLDLSIAFAYTVLPLASIITYKKQTENSGVGQCRETLKLLYVDAVNVHVTHLGDQSDRYATT